MPTENSFERIYVKKARIYQPVLETGLATVPAEARGLAEIFRHYGIEPPVSIAISRATRIPRSMPTWAADGVCYNSFVI